ncbi:amidohydrolase family protein [Nitratireductor sp. XY-223]|uniref:amidohydrolase family protein n=1 Tax=Nitratireductor sp. XY-223 TaxID=2561926 RepID=UPI00145A631C|nr:amidohydrolase family protein [Nitratireductor sp. XY-223]
MKFQKLNKDDVAAEPVYDPDRRIVDSHIHLWNRDLTGSYLTPNLADDLDDGHRVEAVVYVECSERYLSDGPEHLRSAGETDYAAHCANREPRIKGILAHLNLMQPEKFREALNLHKERAQGLLAGVRHAAACDPNRQGLANPGRAAPGILRNSTYRDSVRCLGRHGLVNDHWIFFHQIPDLTRLAQHASETLIVINHFGMPLGVGPYRDAMQEVKSTWRANMKALAACPNVHVKLGGLGAPDCGYDWSMRKNPPSSEEVSRKYDFWIHRTVEMFGPDRCMFGSNFPVERLSVSYRTFWNAMKRSVEGYSDSERDALFSGTARRIYSL